MMLRFVSLCSGIEGASVAWKPLGWDARLFSEVDRDACKVLADRHPEVKNVGDIRNVHLHEGYCDVIVGGTPCQSFSVQGLRKGIDDDRGQLAFEFFRIVREGLPRWVIWENVTGVLSSNGGRDFGTILGALDVLGYGFSWRVLDARFFGVAQRRKRVYLVGHLGGWQRSAAALFDIPTVQKDGRPTFQVRKGRAAAARKASEGDVLGWTGDETPKFGDEIVPTLRAQQGGEGVGVLNGEIRKLTITEWERLQGFPDGYTDVGISDSARRRLIGNSFCVPVIQWIGKRISFLERHHGEA